MADTTKRSEVIAAALNPTCGSCRWFVRTNIGQPFGQCHGTTPTPLVVGVVQSALAGQAPRPMIDSFWPPIMDNTVGCRHREPRAISQIDLSTLTTEEVGGEA